MSEVSYVGVSSVVSSMILSALLCDGFELQPRFFDAMESTGSAEDFCVWVIGLWSRGRTSAPLPSCATTCVATRERFGQTLNLYN